MRETDISAIVEQVPQVLVVDDEPDVCEVLKEFILMWDFKANSTTNPLEVIGELDRRFYNVVILDIILSGKSGIELIPDIRRRSPDTKVIIITGYAEKDTVIQALRLGAADFLEKPIDKEFLFHALKRALYLQRTELESRRAYEELKRSREELLLNEVRLKEANRQLMDTNNALSVLAQNIDRTRSETEFQISQKIKSAILPLMEKFRKSRHLSEFRVDLEVLMDYMDDLLNGLRAESQIAQLLSGTELRVAALIKNGLTTDEIADHMYVSPCTVKSHRRNIRKKLNLDNSSRNLRSYLQTKFEAQGIDENIDVGIDDNYRLSNHAPNQTN